MRAFGVIGSCREKSQLIQRIVSWLRSQGFTVSTIKRVGDEFDLDRPGKDTYIQREAGAHEIIVANSFRWALMHEHREGFDEPDAETLIARLAPVDIVLLEGFRLALCPKIEAVLSNADRRLQQRDDPSVVAVASDVQMAVPVPYFDLADTVGIGRFVLARATPVALSNAPRKTA